MGFGRWVLGARSASLKQIQTSDSKTKGHDLNEIKGGCRTYLGLLELASTTITDHIVVGSGEILLILQEVRNPKLKITRD